MSFGPSASWYDPSEPPPPCCQAYEDGEYEEGTHDPQACIDGQAEDAAEARAERQREDEQDRDWL